MACARFTSIAFKSWGSHVGVLTDSGVFKDEPF